MINDTTEPRSAVLGLFFDRDFHRRHRRIARVEVRATEAPGPIVHQPLSQPRSFVLEALRSLPARQRRVIELLKLHDLSVREVAAQIGMTESAGTSCRVELIRARFHALRCHFSWR